MRGSFAEKGYWVSPVLYDAGEIQHIIRHFDDVLAGRYNLGTKPGGVNGFGSAMVKVANAWLADSVIRQVVLDKQLATVAAVLLGVDELYLWADSLYWKAPRANTEQAVVGWHQDKQYWDISSTTDMITAAIALYPANEESGGLRFAEGSHKWGLVGGSEAITYGDNVMPHSRPPVPQGHQWHEVCPRLEPGQVTFHHSLTFHASMPNQTDLPRRSITIHMVSGEARLTALTNEDYINRIGIGNPFRGPRFPKLYP